MDFFHWLWCQRVFFLPMDTFWANLRRKSVQIDLIWPDLRHFSGLWSVSKSQRIWKRITKVFFSETYLWVYFYCVKLFPAIIAKITGQNQWNVQFSLRFWEWGECKIDIKNSYIRKIILKEIWSIISYQSCILPDRDLRAVEWQYLA